MKLRSLLIGSAAALATSALAAGSAGAATVAAWDFSQFPNPGAFTTDGTTFEITEQLDANYSDLDPNFLGPESAAFGTMFADGTAGSTVGGLTSPFAPNSEDLTENNDVLETNLVFLGDGAALNSLTIEGQENAKRMGLGTDAPASLVFGADLSSIPEFGQDWTLSFGGVTADDPNGSSDIGVEFSTDGSDFSSIGSVVLAGTPAVFSLDAVGSADQAFFRLNIDGSNELPTIDNVGINTTLVPEPGTALLLGGGLAGLAAIGRRRRA